MPKYEVTAEFEDRQEMVRRKPGEVIDVTAGRAAQLQGIGVIGKEPIKEAPAKGKGAKDQ